MIRREHITGERHSITMSRYEAHAASSFTDGWNVVWDHWMAAQGELFGAE
jgi:hypothetical protein